MFDFVAETPHGKPQARAIFDRFLSGLETLNEEIEWRRPDGTALWTRSSVRPIFDMPGRVVATRSMHVDITDRKRAEEALRLSEERLAQILDSAMDAIITFDTMRRIELFNDAAEKVFGCPAAEVLGRPLDRFLTESFHQALENSLARFSQGNQTLPYVWAPDRLLARRADEREFPIE